MLVSNRTKAQAAKSLPLPAGMVGTIQHWNESDQNRDFATHFKFWTLMGHSWDHTWDSWDVREYILIYLRAY